MQTMWAGYTSARPGPAMQETAATSTTRSRKEDLAKPPLSLFFFGGGGQKLLFSPVASCFSGVHFSP